jgi:anaerobic selenocysteine-containing dehydrogenase
VPAWGHLWLGWNEPAIAPLGEAVPNTELWRRLAATFGIDDPLFALDDLALIRLALRDEIDVDRLRADGFHRLPVPDPLLPYEAGGFATRDGRAMLRNDALASLGAPALPEHRDVVRDADLPFALLTPKTMPRFLNSSYSHHHAHLERSPVVEVSAKDLANLGVAEGDVVRVHNDRGALHLPVRVSARVRPGVVAIAWGWWGDDAAVNVLTSDELADWGGGVAFWSTRVSIDRA